MARTYSVLGHVDCTNTGAFAIVDGLSGADAIIISSIVICNRGSSAARVRLWIGPDSTPDDSDFILYDTEIEANKTLILTAGFVMSGVNDYLGILCDTANVVNGQAYGVSIS